MCRRSDRAGGATGRRHLIRSGLRALLVALVAIAPLRVADARDEIAAYLERHGLMELLTVHLEEALLVADGADREELIVRLSGIYAELLEAVGDGDRREELETRSRRLLAEAPEGTTDALRLALLRATYRSIEKIAENHRLRLSNDDDVDWARGALGDLIMALNRLRKQTDAHALLADRRLARASGTEAVVLAEEAESARQINAQCTFLNAWAQYYASWLNDRPDNARIAQRLFVELLDFGDQAPVPENVSVDLRSTEAIARCILGIALCKSLTTSSSAALGWIALLEDDHTHELLREQVPAWRMAIHLEHGEYLSVRSELDGLAAGAEPTPLTWLRLVAVHALEAKGASRYATELARDAVTELAARGELQQVFDLAERYPIDALGSTGFAVDYVSGVLRYHEARGLHGDDDPTATGDAAALYEKAIVRFEAAVRRTDADKYPAARADCPRLIGWCSYFEGRLLAAREAFERAAGELKADAAAEALWMAIVCLDRLVEVDARNQALNDDLAGLIRRFLAEYPANEHAPKLILRRALRTEEVSPEVAEELLAIPPDSPVYLTARRRAAQILYRLFRDTKGGAKIAYGSEYLSVALPLHAQDAQEIDDRDAAAVQRFTVGGRRILEVALQDGIGRLMAARTVLDAFDAELEDVLADEAEIALELDYRRMQERLLSGDAVAATTLADALHDADPGGFWTRRASRTMFQGSRQAWRDADEAGEDSRAVVGRVVRFGSRVLEEYQDDEAAFSHPGVISYASAVAEAAMIIWERSGDVRQGERSLDLFERLLERHPRNAKFLRSAAVLSERLGKPERAVACWRTLVSGTRQESDAWYEAKFRLVSLLAFSDPERARRILDQHRQLHPGYGPDPWGARLKALDLRVPRSAGAEAEGGAG